MERTYWVYILTNLAQTVLYTGITNDIVRRIFEHREKLVPGFTAKYNVSILVYAEQAPTAEAAIVREKQIKAGSRKKKIELIESVNPEWKDLYGTF